MESGTKQVLNTRRTTENKFAPPDEPFSREITQATLVSKCFIYKVKEKEGNEDSFLDFSAPNTVLNAYLSALLAAVRREEMISPLNTYRDYSTISYEVAGGLYCKRQRCMLNLRAKPALQRFRL